MFIFRAKSSNCGRASPGAIQLAEQPFSLAGTPVRFAIGFLGGNLNKKQFKFVPIWTKKKVVLVLILAGLAGKGYGRNADSGGRVLAPELATLHCPD